MADGFVGQMLDKIINTIMDKIIDTCYDNLLDQYRRQTGMKEELQRLLQRLRENHPKIQAVVSASTQAQIRDHNPALNSWIWQLRDAIDETDDVLDDFEYMKLEEEQQEQIRRNTEKTKVRSAGTSLLSLPFFKKRKGDERALKINPILERVEVAVKKLDKVSADVTTFLHLIDNAKQKQQELELQLWKDRETGCLPKNDLIGRGQEKDFVMQWLRKPTNEDPTLIASSTLYKNISLLSIVGHGGMGKTTLLQHIYEDLKDEFQLKIWVCVSKDFDAKKVIADMLECLKKDKGESLVAVQQNLKAAVQSKKFLLVLDDIWEEDMSKWENVLCPLVHGGLGSKILLTTRLDTVASAVANVIKTKMEMLRIKGLEEEVCLTLLNTHAFAGVENPGAHKKLLDIASSMVKKLSGSPLAAKVIGGVLNSNLDDSFWMKILENNILKIEPEPGRKYILSILSLSFTFLPQHLQNCFAFCGVFPQDHQFYKDDLVRMWIALGFIQESSIEGETLEDIGGRYFDVLVRKSFFDEFQHDERIYYKTHDLLHDLARSISSEECFGFVGDDVLSFKVPKNVRHLYVKTENPEVMRIIKDVKNIHSLFLTSERHGQCFTEFLAEIFEESRRIRLLFISSSLEIKISETIKNLRHLRYLNLSARLTHIPRSLSSLYHLRFIIYDKFCWELCYDDFLPGNASNLSNLRYLEVPPKVFSTVPGIGKLRSLQELDKFNVKNENGYRIGELEDMSELRKLKIHSLENVKDAIEACTAKLCKKRKLTDLSLSWGETLVNTELDVNVLENLEPYKNLKRLSIFSYKGVSSAKWMYNADLISNLEYISLNGCSEWETLPPFGQLPHLKSLYLCDMPKAKRLDHKFHGNDKVSVFPSLEVLDLEGLQLLEDWFDGAGATANDCFFPCLTRLFLVDCPNLQELPYLPPKLKKMNIQNIGWKAALICKQETNNCKLETLKVLSCPKISSLLLADVVEVRINGCPNLISLGGLQQVESGAEKSLQSLPSSLERFSSLEILRLEKVPQLQQLLHIPASLKELCLQYLESFQCLPSSLSNISSLDSLSLHNIPLLKSLPELPPSLSRLDINNLDNLQCLGFSLSAISSLNRLYLESIPLLKSLPELPPSLSRLDIRSLDNLECLPSSLSAISSLLELHLESIPLLKSLPELPPSLSLLDIRFLHNLQCLPSSLSAISSLKELYLNSIPLLKSLPVFPPSLSSLDLYRLDKLQCLPSSLSAISSLNRLSLHNIPLLKSLPELPPSLSYISIDSLDNLQCLPSSLSAISSLKGLVLKSIPLLESLPELPPSLSMLGIWSLDSLQCLPSSLSAISSLVGLYLESIPLLKSLPELPPSLSQIFINSLDNLQCLPSSLSAISSLDNLVLNSIPLLKSLPDLPSSCSITVIHCDPELMKRYNKY